MSIKRFRIKKRFLDVIDKIKNFFRAIGNFFHSIKIHPSTERVSYHVRRATNKFSTNISDNNKNWKHRISSSPSFEISEEDG